jgi:hypothetical protein
VACVLCEVVLRSGRIDEFLQLMDKYRISIADDDEDSWIPSMQTDLPDILRQFEVLFTKKDVAVVNAATRKLRKYSRKRFEYKCVVVPNWIRAVYQRQFGNGQSLWQRMLWRLPGV